jgi:hypothetical protein
MNEGPYDSERFSVATLAWGVLGALICGSMVPLEPNMLEEGLILETAQRLVRGDHLYQDVVAFTGPLPFEGLALLFRLFGEEILVARIAVAVLQGGATAAVYSLARASRRDGLEHVAATLAAFAPILLFPLYSTYFYATLAVSIGVIASGVARLGLRDYRWAVLAGILVSASALCKQTIGAVLALGLLICLTALAPRETRRRTALALTGGGMISVVVTLLAFALTGGVGALFYSLVELPISFQSSYDSPLVNFWPPGVFTETIQSSQVFYLPYYWSLLNFMFAQPGWLITLFTQLLYALPFIAIVSTLVRRRHGPFPAAVWIHFVTLLAMSSNLFPRSDWGHLVAVVPSAAIQLVLVAPNLSGRRRQYVTAGVIGLTVLVSIGLGGLLYRVSVAPSFGPRVPLRVVNPGYRGPSVPQAIRYLRAHTEPGDAIFVARAEPLIYFATETVNPTPYGGVIPGMMEEQQRVINEALESTRYVVMSDIDQPIFTYYRDELPDVQKTLERHYRIPDDYLGDGMKWIQVLERGPDRGATHVDLIDEISKGRPWIHAGDGSRPPTKPYPGTVAVAQNRRFLPFLVSARGGGIDFDLEIPPDAFFQASLGFPVAFSSTWLHQHIQSSRMILSIRTDDDDDFEELARADLEVHKKNRRRWRPFEVDLSDYAGRSVTLRIEMLSQKAIRGVTIAWWGSPRIAIRPDAEGR